jgi:hypothetical protein
MASMQLMPLLAMLGEARRGKGKGAHASDEDALFHKLFETLKESEGDRDAVSGLPRAFMEEGDADAELPVELALEPSPENKTPPQKPVPDSLLSILAKRTPETGSSAKTETKLGELLAGLSRAADGKGAVPVSAEVSRKSDLEKRVTRARTHFETERNLFETLKAFSESKDLRSLKILAEKAGLHPKKFTYRHEHAEKNGYPAPAAEAKERGEAATFAKRLSIPTAALLVKSAEGTIQTAFRNRTGTLTPKRHDGSALESLLSGKRKPEPSSAAGISVRQGDPFKEIAEMLARPLRIRSEEAQTRVDTENETMDANIKRMESSMQKSDRISPSTEISSIETPEIAHTEGKISQEALAQKIADAKETVRHFARSLQEQVQNYKPPFSRMQLSLEPKELGSVEVTLVSRGGNLHIQVHSNPAAIGVMATQGQELKSQLVSMGFTDVQMQFNMNQQQQQQQRERRGAERFARTDEVADLYESLDLVVPQYV